MSHFVVFSESVAQQKNGEEQHCAQDQSVAATNESSVVTDLLEAVQHLSALSL